MAQESSSQAQPSPPEAQQREAMPLPHPTLPADCILCQNVLDFSLRFGQDTFPGPACVVGPAVSLVHDYVGFVS